MARKSKEEWKTYQDVFDNFTYRVLDKLIGQGHFAGLVGPVSIGKESNVFTAKTGEGKLLAVKIYRLETCDFNRMFEYIRYDSRFSSIGKQRRKIIFAWVQREFRNLMKARELGVPVPKPIAFAFNVLVEELIGVDEAAPKLKDRFPDNPEEFFEKIFDSVRRLYRAGFVHADLSHFNILNDNGRPVIIDLSTMTPRGDPRFMEHLERDIRNICTFTYRYGVIYDPEEMFRKVIT